MSKLYSLPAIILGLLLIFQPPAWSAEQHIVLTDDVQMTLGDAFMAEGDYYRAITEYKKMVILFPDSARFPEALYQIGMAYYRGKDYTAAVKNFAKVRQTYADSHFTSAAFYEGLSYERLGMKDAANLAFERARTFDARHQDAANAHLGLILNAVEREDIAKGRSELNSFQAKYQTAERVPGIEKAFSLLDRYEAQSKKSPGLAGAMSAIVPGSGQMYAERYMDGLMAFVVNGLFIAGTISAIDDGNYALAGIVGGIGLPFYVGNIYGASNAAHKWNLSLGRQLQDDLSLTLSIPF